MIRFEKIKFRNFLSYGNKEIEFDLSSGNLSLIMGENGSGKSVLIDVIHFSLFGSGYRKVKINELVNRINKRKMEVEITFSKNDEEYRIFRSERPKTFIIYKNNEELKSLGVNEQQEMLENEILNFDKKTFCQIVLMGSSYHIPFLRLPLPQKREIIEELFDLDIISKMLDFSKFEKKEKIKLKENVDNELKLYDSQIQMEQENLKRAELHNKNIDDRVNELEEKLKKEIEKKVVIIHKQEEELKKYINDENEFNLINEQISKIQNGFNLLNEQINNIELKINDEFRIKIDEKKLEIKKVEDNIRKLEEKNRLLNDEKQLKLSKESIAYQEKNYEIQSSIKLLEKDLKDVNVDFKFYQNNDVCNECGSELKGERIDKIVEELKNKGIKLNKEIKKLEEQSDVLFKQNTNNKNKIGVYYKEGIDINNDGIGNEKNKILELNEKIIDIEALKLKKVEQEKQSINENIITLKKELKILYEQKLFYQEKIDKKYQLEKEIIALNEQLKNDKVKLLNIRKNLDYMDIKEIENRLKNKKEEKSIKYKEYVKFEKIIEYYNELIIILGDNGVRKIIISKYIEILNRKILEFLELFDCQMKLKLKDDFSIDIVIRENEEINYENFSGGERQRMDLAILFTFMSFARLKANVSTNLLIFDEVLDSSLDEEGVEVLFNILKIMSIEEEYSIHIISHRVSNLDRFDTVKQIKKNSGFSEINEWKGE